MILLSEKLSKDIPFLRVDLYDNGNSIYVGELTFYPAGGFDKFTDKKIDILFGDWIKLPKRKLLYNKKG